MYRQQFYVQATILFGTPLGPFFKCHPSGSSVLDAVDQDGRGINICQGRCWPFITTIQMWYVNPTFDENLGCSRLG